MAKQKIFCVIDDKTCTIKGAYANFETAINLAKAFSTVEDIHHSIKPIPFDFIDFAVLGQAVIKKAEFKEGEKFKILDQDTKIVV